MDNIDKSSPVLSPMFRDLVRSGEVEVKVVAL